MPAEKAAFPTTRSATGTGTAVFVGAVEGGRQTPIQFHDRENNKQCNVHRCSVLTGSLCFKAGLGEVRRDPPWQLDTTQPHLLLRLSMVGGFLYLVQESAVADVGRFQQRRPLKQGYELHPLTTVIYDNQRQLLLNECNQPQSE